MEVKKLVEMAVAHAKTQEKGGGVASESEDYPLILMLQKVSEDRFNFTLDVIYDTERIDKYPWYKCKSRRLAYNKNMTETQIIEYLTNKNIKYFN